MGASLSISSPVPLAKVLLSGLAPYSREECGKSVYNVVLKQENVYMDRLECRYDSIYHSKGWELLDTGVPGKQAVSGLAFDVSSGLYIGMDDYTQDMLLIDANRNVVKVPYERHDKSVDGADIYYDDALGVAVYLRVATVDGEMVFERTYLDWEGSTPFRTERLSLSNHGHGGWYYNGTGLVATESGRFFVTGIAFHEKYPNRNVLFEITPSYVNTSVEINKVLYLHSPDVFQEHPFAKPSGSGWLIGSIAEVDGCLGNKQLLLIWISIGDEKVVADAMTMAEFDLLGLFEERHVSAVYESKSQYGFVMDSASCSRGYGIERTVLSGFMNSPSKKANRPSRMGRLSKIFSFLLTAFTTR